MKLIYFLLVPILFQANIALGKLCINADLEMIYSQTALLSISQTNVSMNGLLLEQTVISSNVEKLDKLFFKKTSTIQFCAHENQVNLGKNRLALSYNLSVTATQENRFVSTLKFSNTNNVIASAMSHDLCPKHKMLIPNFPDRYCIGGLANKWSSPQVYGPLEIDFELSDFAPDYLDSLLLSIQDEMHVMELRVDLYYDSVTANHQRYLELLDQSKNLEDAIEGKTFDQITDADFAGLGEFRDYYYRLKKDVSTIRKDFDDSIKTTKEEMAKLQEAIEDIVDPLLYQDIVESASDIQFTDPLIDISTFELDELPAIKEGFPQYKQFADETISRLSNALSSKDRRLFLELTFAWSKQHQILASNVDHLNPTEWQAIIQSKIQVKTYLDKYLTSDFWFKDSPVDQETRQIFADITQSDSIQPSSLSAVKELGNSLKLLEGRGLTNSQKGLILTIKLIGQSFIEGRKSLASTHEKAKIWYFLINDIFLKMNLIINSTGQELTNTGKCVASSLALGDAGDVIEIVGGFSICDSSKLSTFERVLSLTGLAIGNSALYRAVGYKIPKTLFHSADKLIDLGKSLKVSSKYDIRQMVRLLGRNCHVIVQNHSIFRKFLNTISFPIFPIAYASKSTNCSLEDLARKARKLADFADEIGLDLKKILDRYGDAAINSISDDGVKAAAKKWGTLSEGKHQLFEHTVEYAKVQAKRMTGLESRAGLPSGSLIKAASNDPTEVATAIKNMQNVADDIVSTGSSKVEDLKVHYWKQSSTRPKEGIRVIEYDGKIQSVNPMNKKAWEKFNQ